MTGGRKKPEEQRSGPPGWIVSFSDMITLLLSFFILLQAFAHSQDPDLFYIGQGSFKRAISGLGIPDVLLGKEPKPERDYRKLKYPTESTDEKLTRRSPVDAEDDRIREIFEELQRAIETRSTDVAEKPINVFTTPIRFKKNEARLDRPSEEFLTDFARNLAQSLSGRAINLYVIGLAADQEAMKRRWVVSAQRARAAETFLARRLAAEIETGRWELYSWGAGPGGQWCKTFGLVPKHTYIVIAVAE